MGSKNIWSKIIVSNKTLVQNLCVPKHYCVPKYFWVSQVLVWRGSDHWKLRYRTLNIDVVGWSAGRPDGRSVPDNNNTTLWLHLASWFEEALISKSLDIGPQTLMWSGGRPAGRPVGRPVPDNNITTLWLHLASWNLPESQLSWESKMEPSVAIRKLKKHFQMVTDIIFPSEFSQLIRTFKKLSNYKFLFGVIA